MENIFFKIHTTKKWFLQIIYQHSFLFACLFLSLLSLFTKVIMVKLCLNLILFFYICRCHSSVKNTFDSLSGAIWLPSSKIFCKRQDKDLPYSYYFPTFRVRSWCKHYFNIGKLDFQLSFVVLLYVYSWTFLNIQCISFSCIIFNIKFALIKQCETFKRAPFMILTSPH